MKVETFTTHSAEWDPPHSIFFKNRRVPNRNAPECPLSAAKQKHHERAAISPSDPISDLAVPILRRQFRYATPFQSLVRGPMMRQDSGLWGAVR